jgi:hypothetical protein
VFRANSQGGLWQVPAAGGEPKELTKVKQGELTHNWPKFLPDGIAILFSVSNGTTPDNDQIVAKRLETGEEKVLIRGGTYPSMCRRVFCCSIVQEPCLRFGLIPFAWS